MQLGFQPGISVQQEILKAQSNAEQGLNHVAVLDLVKAYDMVDRGLLLMFIAEEVHGNCVRMLKETLGTLMESKR